MNDDAALLRRYAEEGSEDAFTELVQRHVDLVYGAALRRTGGDAHRAADVAQDVFTALARQARRLSRHAVLSAWLHTATRNAAINLMISEQRRKARELKASALDVATAGDPAMVLDWERVRPAIDSAIDELPATDRAAVILRFLERRPFADVAAALNLSEDAARMRTDRALDKLRALLERRGITSTAAALVTVVSSQPVLSAPAGLAGVLAAKSLAGSGAGVGTSTGVLLSFMTTKLVLTGGGAAVVAFAIGAYVGLDYTTSLPLPPPPETPRQVQMIAALRQENQQLKADVARLTSANTALREKASQVPATAASKTAVESMTDQQKAKLVLASQQKAILNNLRQIAAARDQFALENGRSPASIDELVGETKYIKRLVSVGGETYAQVAMVPGQPLAVTTAEGVTVSYDDVKSATTPEALRLASSESRVMASVKGAVEAYRIANGAMPPNEQALIPYFATPQEGADFVELIEARKGKRNPGSP